MLHLPGSETATPSTDLVAASGATITLSSSFSEMVVKTKCKIFGENRKIIRCRIVSMILNRMF